MKLEAMSAASVGWIWKNSALHGLGRVAIVFLLAKGDQDFQIKGKL